MTPYLGLVAQTPISVGAPLTTGTVTGLANGTTYGFRVAAVSAAGSGAPSARAEVTVGAPVAPAVGSSLSGDGEATVQWSVPAANGAPVTGYVVTPYIEGGAAQPSRTYASPATSQVVTGLTNGVDYWFAVAAVNARGTGPASARGGAITVGLPAAPVIGVATVTGAGEVTVSWTAPAPDGRSPITAYAVTPYSGYAPGWARVFPATATTWTVTGLPLGVPLRFRVEALNDAGWGRPSSVSSRVNT